MHYMGMAAMLMPAETTYRPGFVAASVLIAVVAATAALWIAFNLSGGWQRLGASIVMGIAVCGMHYTGMAAAVFVPTATVRSSHSAIGSDTLAYLVFGVTLLILTLLSVGGRALAGNLHIAAKISILTGVGTLVALGGTSILLIRMEARLAHDQQVFRSSLQQVEMAMGLQVTLKRQVQEWKNILLRGRDSAELEEYRKSFFREESQVQANGQALLSLFTQPSTRVMAARFLKAHGMLGQRYRAALDAFVRGGRMDYQSADRMVRDQDRALTALIDLMVRSIIADQEHEQSKHEAELLSQKRRTALGAAVLFSGLILVGIWMARRITSPVLDLSRVISRVAAEKDYTLRVRRGSGDEIGLLADGFNQMLAQVQSQNAALQGAHADLEGLVVERTAELGRANDGLMDEIKERERGYAERARLAAFTADVGGALTRSESLSRALDASAEAMVEYLGAANATIWVLHSKEQVLERKATAGDGANLRDSLERIPVGQFRIGRIAAEGLPRIMDLTSDPPEEGDKDWARRQGMVSFAGHPLKVGGKSVGVMAMFARKPITKPALNAMATVADAIALGIDRARAAESLRVSETLTRSIIEGMLDGLVTVGRDDRIKSVNPAADRIFGYTRGELIGQPISCLMSDSEGAPPTPFLQNARTDLMGRVTEWQGRRKGGATFPFELALFEFWTSEGRHLGGAIKDLSERYEIDRLKGEFVSTVSHELRTPLTSIRGALGLVVGGAAGALPAQAKSLLDIALKNSERLARLVNDILDMEKIESGKLEFRMEELQLAPLLETAVEGNRAYAEQYGVALAIENDVLGAGVRADTDRLTQVITNLLSNAVKFSPKGETVRLIASIRESVVRLEVRDRGPGIPEEFRSRIFGRFQQADSSDTRQKGGTGLGLAITRLIVEQLGGAVGFDTEIGQGSTFWVELPLLGVATVRPSPASEAAGPLRPRIRHVEASAMSRPRILHVDDDMDLPKIVAAALSEFADVDIARGIREAKERLAGRSYDFVVLDVGLPDGSGLELQPLLDRPAGHSTPFVLFTAHEITKDAAGAAAAVFIKSRSSIAEVVEAVKSLLAAAPRRDAVSPAGGRE